MKNNLKKKLTVSTAIGILVVGSCFPSFAAGTQTKTVDGIRVTAKSSVSERTATASTERTKAGTASVYMYYEYKQTNSNLIGTGTKQDTVGGTLAKVSYTPANAVKMYDVSGTHKVYLPSGELVLYT